MASSACTKPIFPSSFTLSSSSSKSKLSHVSFISSTSPIHIYRKLSHANPCKRSLAVNNALKTVDPTETSVGSSKSEDVGSLGEKPTILVSEKLGEAGLKVLRSWGHVECAYELSQEELCTKISCCDALIVRSGTKVTREVFEAGKGRLKVVGRAGVGIDNVDLQAATEFGCLVVNAPTANTIAAAEHGIALLAAMARNIAQADASTKAGIFLLSSFLFFRDLNFHILISFFSFLVASVS